jgi:hypothetical protein
MKLSRAGRALVSLSAVASVAAGGCGGGGEETSSESSSPTTAAEASTPVDTGKFADCVLYKAPVDVPITPVGKPGKEVEQFSADNDAPYLVARRSDEGFFYLFQANDLSKTQEVADALPALLEQQASDLDSTGETSVQVNGPIVAGFVPDSPETADQLVSEQTPLIEGCIEKSS